MAIWNVPVKVEQSDEYPKLTNDDLIELVLSLPGGGSGSSGDSLTNIGPRAFSHAAPVEADTKGEAEGLAPNIVNAAIDHDRYPGWRVTDVGDARGQADLEVPNPGLCL